MDRTNQARQLRKVEGHIAKGQRHIARQQEIITELEADGHDASPTRRGLETFESNQLQSLSTRETIQDDLKSAD